jgi:hypothetical protein
MYIFVKIHNNNSSNNEKPFIIEEHNLELALDKITEKYYNFKLSTILKYPTVIEAIKIIRSL